MEKNDTGELRSLRREKMELDQLDPLVDLIPDFYIFDYEFWEKTYYFFLCISKHRGKYRSKIILLPIF